MPQVTLSVPNEKLPVLTDLMQALGLEDKAAVEQTLAPTFKTTISDATNSFFKKHFSWEYYSNELEFE